MFAVIRTGGKQYRVAEDDKLKIDKVAGEPGEIITFAEVLMLGGDNLVVGTPSIAGASVAAEVIDQGRTVRSSPSRSAGARIRAVSAATARNSRWSVSASS
jgi:ribosomal protein L21